VRKPAASGNWSWDGGTAITVASGETIDTIARRHGVPASVIMQANNITAPATLYPGQRDVPDEERAISTNTEVDPSGYVGATRWTCPSPRVGPPTIPPRSPAGGIFFRGATASPSIRQECACSAETASRIAGKRADQL